MSTVTWQLYSIVDYNTYHDKFTSGEVDMLKDSFSFFDKENNGTMLTTDLALALRSVGFLITEKEANNLVKKFDPENSSVLDVRYGFAIIPTRDFIS